jgi:hypothetical protein
MRDYSGWVSPGHRDDTDAEAFAAALAHACAWPLDAFGGGYPWDTAIPPRDQWDAEIAALNAHLISLGS